MNRLLLACACVLLWSACAPASAAEAASLDTTACPPGLPADADVARCPEQAVMARVRLYFTTSDRLRSLPAASEKPAAGGRSVELTVRVQVVGDDGQPVPYAALWNVVLHRRTPMDAGALIGRLASNYGYDVDIVENARLHRAMLVSRADRDGRATVVAPASEMDDAPAGSATVAIAALKRGWQPATTTVQDAVGSTRTITLHLKPQPGFVDDDAVAELDEIRAALQPDMTRPMDQSPERGRALAAAAARVRRLAEQANAADKRDVAATLYEVLAQLPSMDFFKDAAGASRGVKVVNGYDDRSPARVADHQHALALNTSNPQMLFERMRDTYRDDPKLPRSILIGEPRQRALLADELALHARFGASLWPVDYVEEWRLMALLGQYAAACARLKEFHRFEPTFETDDGWRNAVGYIALSAKDRGDTYLCDLDETRAH